jgi:MFS family permease
MNSVRAAVTLSRSHRYAFLAALYFVQGLPYGFQTGALPVYLRSQGASLHSIGLLGALSLPWMLKALWSPLVDRYYSPALGRRKSWIIPAQALLATCCLLAAVLAGANTLTPLLILILLMNLFAATQDIAVDGWAIDQLEPEELGPANAIQVVGYKAGMLTGGGLLVWASGWLGWSGLFVAMGALVLAVLGLVLLTPEKPTSRDVGEGERPALKEVLERLKAALALPGARWFLLFIATYKLGESMADAMFRPFLVDQGFTPAQIGQWVGTWGMLASILGSALGGWLTRRLNPRQAVVLAALARAIPMLAQAALAVIVPTPALVIGVTVSEHLAGGMLTTAMFALMMSRVDRRIGATHYTLLATVEVLGKFPGSWASGYLAESTGFAGVFGLAALLSIAFLGLLTRVPPTPPQQVPAA